VEAAGVEPDPAQNANWLMARDFRRISLEIRCLLGNSLCSGVLSSALECSPVLETFWRRRLAIHGSMRGSDDPEVSEALARLASSLPRPSEPSPERPERSAPSGATAVEGASRARPPLQCRPVRRILNRMVQYKQARLDDSFAALSDATRRGVLEQLGRSDASITDLAEKFHMTLTGMKKHVGVLEEAGLVTTEKVGRVRTCKLGPRRLEEETAWLERYRQLWDSRFDMLDKVVEELKRKEKIDGRKKRE